MTATTNKQMKEYSISRKSSVLQHLSGPGAFRLFLASLVILEHTSRVNFGATAVSVFFALSGYWICRIWRERYVHCIHPYQTFAISRLWRLMPVFLLAGGLAMAVDATLTNGLRTFLSESSPLTIAHTAFSNLFILGYRSAEYRPLVPAWSLDIEMQFYLLAPMLITFLLRHQRTFVAAGIALCLISAFIAGTHVFVSYFIYFGAGMLCAVHQWRPRRSLIVGSTLLVSVVILTVLIGSVLLPEVLNGSVKTSWIARYNWLLNALVALLLLPYAFSTVYRKGAARDGMYGDVSYIVYLLHWPGVVWLATYFSQVPPAERWPVTLLVWVSAFLLSYLVWRYFDRPIDRLRSRFVKRRQLSRSTINTPPLHAAVDVHLQT